MRGWKQPLRLWIPPKHKQSRHEATRKYMNAMISKGTPVRDHVLNMANHINEAELHRAIIDERTQVSIYWIHSLLISFNLPATML